MLSNFIDFINTTDNETFNNNIVYGKKESSIIKKYNLNLLFLKNYTIITKPLYNFVDSVINTDGKIKKYDIVLLTLYSLSILEKESKKESEKLLDVLKLKKLDGKTFLSITNLKKLFTSFNIYVKKPIRFIQDIYDENLLSIFILYIKNLIIIIQSNNKKV